MAQVQCELTIIKLTNLNADLSSGKLFIRYFVCIGGGRRIRIDTREIQCTSEAFWDDKSSMECFVPLDSMEEAICKRNVVFELRWRRDKPVFGAKAWSKLVGRAEVAWKDVLGSNGERRVSFPTKKLLAEGLKPPTLFVKMGINVSKLQVREERKREHECRCESCRWIGSEEDLFVAANAASNVEAW